MAWNKPRGKKYASKGPAGTEVLFKGTGESVELDLRWIGRDEKTIDFKGQPPCTNCDTHVGPEGQMMGRMGRLSVYFIDPRTKAWIDYAMACPQCVYGALAHMAIDDGDFRRPELPYDHQHPTKVPPGLTNEEWRVLGVYHKTGDTYLEAAGRITSDMGAVKEGLMRKLEGR